MKIIDLLNKIANGEDVPKKIKYNGIIRDYNEREKDYKSYEDNVELYLFYGVLASSTGEKLKESLNDKVEILDEAKENKIEKLYYDEYEKLNYDVDKVCYFIRPINKLIDELNKLKE